MKNVLVISFLFLMGCSSKGHKDFFPIKNPELISNLIIKSGTIFNPKDISFEPIIISSKEIIFEFVSAIDNCHETKAYNKSKEIKYSVAIEFVYLDKKITYPLVERENGTNFMLLFSRGEYGSRIGRYVCDDLLNLIKKHISMDLLIKRDTKIS